MKFGTKIFVTIIAMVMILIPNPATTPAGILMLVAVWTPTIINKL